MEHFKTKPYFPVFIFISSTCWEKFPYDKHLFDSVDDTAHKVLLLK